MSHANVESHAGHEARHHAHHPRQAHHFETMSQQIFTGKLGMWFLLVTELLMFGGLFCAYAVWRAHYFEQFDIGHMYLDTFWGAVNTVVLLVSSFTMAWAVRTSQLNKRRATTILLALTFLGGLGFMVIKYMEYSHKYHMGLFIGNLGKWEEFKVKAAQAVPVATDASPALPTTVLAAAGHAGDHAHDDQLHADWDKVTPQEAARRLSARTFFSIYFCMTGLHGIHVVIGMGLIGWILLRNMRGEFDSVYNAPVDLVGLYWHLVDLIWIFLFPLLYLIH